ncbi:retinol dehydrogenase 12-like, partial [Olea europaea subsp. europaea]
VPRQTPHATPAVVVDSRLDPSHHPTHDLVWSKIHTLSFSTFSGIVHCLPNNPIFPPNFVIIIFNTQQQVYMMKIYSFFLSSNVGCNFSKTACYNGAYDCGDFWLDALYCCTWKYYRATSGNVMFSSVLHKRLPAEAGISVVCVSPGIVQTNVARDLPKIVQAGYHLMPYFIFSAEEGSRSTLFAATDPQVPEYCEMLKADEWPVCAFISQDCRPTNPSEESHNLETSYKVWEKTLEMVGLPSDAVERLIEGEEVECKYGASQ